MKNGPPATAVTSPSGISAGGSAERAIASASTTTIAPTSADAGKQRPMQRPDEPARDVRRGEADEGDQPAEGDGRRHDHRPGQHREHHEAAHVEAEGDRHRLAQAQHVEPARERLREAEAAEP